MITNENRKGKFIVIDGVDGVGKPTLIELIKMVMIKNDNIVYLRDQYVDNPISANIKKIITSNGSTMNTECAAMLSIASRILLNEVIEENLKQGKTVICDRYLSTTLVFNTNDKDEQLNTMMISKILKNGYIKPDTYIILRYKDISYAKNPTDYMEAKFHPIVSQQKYEQLAEFLDNVVFIDVDHKSDNCANTLKVLLDVLSFYDDFKDYDKRLKEFSNAINLIK